MISLQKTNVFTIKTPNTRRNTRARVSHEKDDNPIYVKSVDKLMQIEREIKKLRAELKLLKSNAYALIGFWVCPRKRDIFQLIFHVVHSQKLCERCKNEQSFVWYFDSLFWFHGSVSLAECACARIRRWSKGRGRKTTTTCIKSTRMLWGRAELETETSCQ